MRSIRNVKQADNATRVRLARDARASEGIGTLYRFGNFLDNMGALTPYAAALYWERCTAISEACAVVYPTALGNMTTSRETLSFALKRIIRHLC